MNTIGQLADLKRRRHSLALQQARYGISADPHISIELGNIEALINLMDRIDIHRGNLVHLLRQRDHFGANVPAHIINQIASEREQIERLRSACSRQYHQPVESHPVDADQPPMSTALDEPLPLSTDPIAHIREALRDIEALIKHAQIETALNAIQALQRKIGG